MSSFGLPKILELTIDSILENGKLASYKIAGNGLRTSIVLRFKARIAGTSVSPIHQSTSLRRKSTNQMRRDKERLEQHKNPSTVGLCSRTSTEIHVEKRQWIFRSVETTALFTMKVCLTQLLSQGERLNKPKHSKTTVPTIRYH